MRSDAIRIFLCGDVMTGRGIDQILPHAGDPRLHEAYVRDANVYVELAERANGPIERPVGFDYIWGASLAELERAAPDARIVNLETSVTQSDDHWPGKGIHYRMHPGNVPCLTAAAIDCCVLANNHVLDWGYAGLEETLRTLHAAGLRTAGAGSSRKEAAAPAVVDVGGRGRVLVFGFGTESSGCPRAWQARQDGPGINMTGLSRSQAERAARAMQRHKEPGDVVVASVHWGGNWGYRIPEEQRAFAHALVDSGVVDVVHGHSSHHAKGVEIYEGRPILYGCGDFITDYEGIQGYEQYRGDLSLMWIADVEPSAGELLGLEITPFRLRRMRLEPASPEDTAWLEAVLSREGEALGTRLERTAEGKLRLQRR